MSLTDIFGAQFPYLATSSFSVSALLLMLPVDKTPPPGIRNASLGFLLISISALILTLAQDPNTIAYRGFALMLMLFGVSCLLVELGNITSGRKILTIFAAVVASFGFLIFVTWIQSPPYFVRLAVVDIIFTVTFSFFGLFSLKMSSSNYPISRFVLSWSAFSFAFISLLRLLFFLFLREHYFVLVYFSYLYVSIGVFTIFGLGFGFALTHVEWVKSEIKIKDVENTKLLNDLKAKKKELEDLNNFFTHEIVRPINSAKSLCKSMRPLGDYAAYDATQFYAKYEKLQKLENEIDKTIAQIQAVRNFDDVTSLLDNVSISDLDIKYYFHTVQTRWNVKLKLDKNTFGRSLQADCFLFDIAIDNIIENAFKHGNGVVSLFVSCDEQNVCHIDVIDEGAGIPTSHWQEVWDIYFRVNTALSNITNGSGIGMFLTGKILSAHKGIAQVVSNSPSTVRMSLPCR